MNRSGGGSTTVTPNKRPSRDSRTTLATTGNYFEDDEDDSAVSEQDRDSDFEAGKGESSGSEYGGKKGKKKAVKATPKGRGGKKGAAKPKSRSPAKKKGGSSPVKKNDKAAGKKGSPGKGKKGAPPKKKGGKAASDSEDEVSNEYVTSDDEVSDSYTNSDSSSGSEYGKKPKKKASPKKRVVPTRRQPSRGSGKPDKKKKAGSPKKRAREEIESDEDEEQEEVNNGEEGKNGNGTGKLVTKKPKLADSEEDEDEEMKEAENESEDKEDTKQEDDSEDDEEPAVKPEQKSTPKPADKKPVAAKPNPAKPAVVVPAKPAAAAPTALKNPIDTDLETACKDTERKGENGLEHNFKIGSWNVAGLKAIINKKGLDYILKESPQIMCLQETKIENIPAEMKEKISEKYPHIYTSHSTLQAGSNGICTLSSIKPVKEVIGFPIDDKDNDESKEFKTKFNNEGRLIMTEFQDFILLNTYVPNGGRGVKEIGQKKAYPPRVSNGERIQWDKLLTSYIQELELIKPVILAGDLNVAHQAIDLANPSTNGSTAGYTQEERDGFTELLKTTGLVDSFRRLNPDEAGAYTYWTYMANARARNIGWRLDYFCVSQKLIPNLVDNVIRANVFGSDHAPIVLFINI